MYGDEYTWQCPDCKEVITGLGPGSLALLKSNHIYYSHTRSSAAFAKGGYIGNPAPGSSVTDFIPPLLVRGFAALDDAFYDGARLSKTDYCFLRSMKICWNQPRLVE